MPLPPANATAAWRHARLARIIEELAARVPMDAAQGHLAGQIVVTQFLADDMAARIHAPGLALADMCRLNRTTDDLLRTVTRLERALERRQAAAAWRSARHPAGRAREGTRALPPG